MEMISNVDFENKIREIYDSVFASSDPYGAPFQKSIQDKLLLYEFRYGLVKDGPWLHPITESIKLLGEEGFYVSLLRRKTEPCHWYVPLTEAGDYIKEVFPAENMIYSASGRWGLICSEEDHAIIGGPENFINAIRNLIPDWSEREKSFLENWKRHYENNNIDLTWLPVLLSHIYSPIKCKEMLKSVELEWLMK